jgi:MFS family permease
MVVSIGVGRFAYTPMLPLMAEQAGLDPAGGALVATANYAGYFAGALMGIVFPQLVRFRAGFRWAMVVLTATLAAMPLAQGVLAWSTLRCLCGVASAAVFMTAAASLLAHLHGRTAHLSGWGYAGVGLGITLTGLTVLVLRQTASWQAGWEASALLAAITSALAWTMPLEPPPATASGTAAPAMNGDRVAAPAARAKKRLAGKGAAVSLTISYTLEGAGYVIAGTFLVAAIAQAGVGSIGPGAWVIVGLAAAPSCAVWTWAARRLPGALLLAAALAIQSVGLALAALAGGPVSVLIAALLFGGTFMGTVALTMSLGRQLPFRRAVAVLTAGYALGQIIGPLIVRAVVAHGYRPALLVGAAVVLVATLAALACARLTPKAASRGGANVPAF